MKLQTRVCLLSAPLVAMLAQVASAQETDQNDFVQQASEVTNYTRTTFYLERSGLYREVDSRRRPAYLWPAGVWFTSLVAAARHDAPTYRRVMDDYFAALDQHWDAQVTVPGYEPVPTRGGGNDKYNDDNAWLVITFLEAYAATDDAAYLKRAEETLNFVLNGWDERQDGGIWWHQRHKDGTKNVCVNAPAAVACLKLAQFKDDESAARLIDQATSLVNWTVDKLQADDGLFHDRIVVATGEVKRSKLTYNAALMIRAMLGLHLATGDKAWLDKAKHVSKASDWFTSRRTGAFRDHVKWSHLLVEADLELYRTTGEQYLMERATANATYHYNRWQRVKPNDLISNASIARMLWLMADTVATSGKREDAQEP